MHPLQALLAEFRFSVPNWRFSVEHTMGGYGPDAGAYLLIRLRTPDSDDLLTIIEVAHSFPVPADLDFPPRFWFDWLWGCVLQVLTHEAGENFWIGDQRPFYPGHKPGEDRYPFLKDALASNQQAPS